MPRVLGRPAARRPRPCVRRERWYEVALAPPMAAEALGRPGFTIDDLVAELRWPDAAVDVGWSRPRVGCGHRWRPTAIAWRSVPRLEPDLVVVVADAGLGTINAVRLSPSARWWHCDALSVVVLNRFDDARRRARAQPRLAARRRATGRGVARRCRRARRVGAERGLSRQGQGPVGHRHGQHVGSAEPDHSGAIRGSLLFGHACHTAFALASIGIVLLVQGLSFGPGTRRRRFAARPRRRRYLLATG